MKTVQYLIYSCFILIFVGGAGTIGALVLHTNALRLPFMVVLCAGLGLFVVTLATSLLLGAYLYFFTDRKSLTYFSKD